MTTTGKITIEEFAQITEPGRYDVIDGELIVMAPAGGQHGEVASELIVDLGGFVRRHKLGKVFTAETTFILARDPDVLLAPDVAFVRVDRLPPWDQRSGFLPLAPDFAVEIVSPSDRMAKVHAKIEKYLLLGTRLVWMIEPRRRTVTVYEPGKAPVVFHEYDVLDGGDVLPGFRFPVATLFT